MLSPRIRHLLLHGKENNELADEDGSLLGPFEVVKCDIGLVADAIIRLEKRVSEIECKIYNLNSTIYGNR